MEFSVIIPAAVSEILKDKPELSKKCMNCCHYSCTDLVKFICVGCGPREIVSYLKEHPTFAEKVVKDYEEEIANCINFNFEDFDEFEDF